MATVFDEVSDFFQDEDVCAALREKLFDSEGVEEECIHETYQTSEGKRICEKCGCEIELLDFQPEWRFYGTADNRTSCDPSRCHRSKDSSRGSIETVFEGVRHDFSKAIKEQAERQYKFIVKNGTFRGGARKAIVAACIFNILRDKGMFKTYDQIREIFGLTKKSMSTGINKYNEAFPGSRNNEITPMDLLRGILETCKIDIDPHYKNVCRIARCLHKVNATLNRSSPHSVACAIVYLYVCLTDLKKHITRASFVRTVRLSEITITKLVNIAIEVLGNQDLMAN